MTLVWFVFLLSLAVGISESTTEQGQLIDFSDISIECDPSGVEISINGSALGESLPLLDTSTLRVGHSPWASECYASEDSVTSSSSRGFKLFKFKYGQCHPDVEDLTDTQLRLVYKITGVSREDGESTPGGTSVSCFVPKDGLVSAKIAGHTKTYDYVGDTAGKYQFGMTLYRDSFMTVPVENEEEIPLGVPLWVGIKMNSSSSSEMYVRDCWATPSPTKSSDQPEHVFVRKGIIGDDDETFSPVDDVITAGTYGFSFDSFMFRGSGSRVYIKCNVHVCDPYYTDTYKESCSIPKYPEYQVTARDLEFGSGSGSGFGLNMETRDTNEEDGQLDDDNDDDNAHNGDRNDDQDSNALYSEEDLFSVSRKEFPVFYVMHSFKVRHMERKRRSAGSYRIYPRHTVFSNLRSGITLAIIIASTAMLSACAILLPLHLAGEKVRCLHMKAVKRTI